MRWSVPAIRLSSRSQCHATSCSQPPLVSSEPSIASALSLCRASTVLWVKRCVLFVGGPTHDVIIVKYDQKERIDELIIMNRSAWQVACAASFS